jgi:hypothetical protein
LGSKTGVLPYEGIWGVFFEDIPQQIMGSRESDGKIQKQQTLILTNKIEGQ